MKREESGSKLSAASSSSDSDFVMSSLGRFPVLSLKKKCLITDLISEVIISVAANGIT